MLKELWNPAEYGRSIACMQWAMCSCNHIRARKMGTYSIVDVKIQVDNMLSVSAAHQVAKRVRLTLLDAIPQVNDVMVRQ